jgi:hypothetical protein
MRRDHLSLKMAFKLHEFQTLLIYNSKNISIIYLNLFEILSLKLTK